MQYLVLYLPVIHRGYVDFLQKFQTVDQVFLLDRVVAHTLRSLQKDIRALSAREAKICLEALGFSNLTVADKVQLQKINQSFSQVKLIMPDEDIMRLVAGEYLPSVPANQIQWQKIFLRWDTSNTLAEEPVQADKTTTVSDFVKSTIHQLQTKAQQSPDWWRQVAAAVVRDDAILLHSYNTHLPDESQAYFDGDPRANFSKGQQIELSTAQHAEAALIAQAAKKGISLDGASLLVTTFPCPVCAKLIAQSGIQKVYFKNGYSMVHGAEIMKKFGIEIIKVVD